MQLTPDSRFMIKKSMPGMGEGLFTVRALAAGEFVLEYTGKRLPTATAEEQTGSRYLFVVDDEWTIDGAAEENPARYINHACEPNAEARIENGRIVIYAVKDIRSGEEITIDYGQEYFDEYIAPAGCKCATCVNRRPSASAARIG